MWKIEIMTEFDTLFSGFFCIKNTGLQKASFRADFIKFMRINRDCLPKCELVKMVYLK